MDSTRSGIQGVREGRGKVRERRREREGARGEGERGLGGVDVGKKMGERKCMGGGGVKEWRRKER